MTDKENDKCSICGCQFKSGKYATDTPSGRAHHSRHHFIAERFFGRTKNKTTNKRTKIFSKSPWLGVEGRTTLLCYDCHEELLHNPILLPKDIEKFSELVKSAGFNETQKAGKQKIASRITLFHKVIQTGLDSLARKRRTVKT